MKCDVIAAGIVSAAKEVRPCPACCVMPIYMTALYIATALACTLLNKRLTSDETCHGQEVRPRCAADRHGHRASTCAVCVVS